MCRKSMIRGMILLLLASAGGGKVSARFEAENVRWIEQDYDFGLMKEVAGPRTGTSRFVNGGEEWISLIEARPSCGCTSVEYPHEGIAPGDTAVISFTYDPAGRPGRFEKSIRLTFGDGSRGTIHISGNVLGTPESLSLFYPVEAGPLRLSDEIVNGGEVEFGRAPTRFINAYNQRPDTVRPRMVSLNPALTVGASTEKAGPGDIITYTLTFDSRVCGLSGPVDVAAELYPDEGEQPVAVVFRANVAPPPATLVPKDAAKAPHCFIAPNPLDLGTIPGGYPARFEFTVMNQGKNPLEIQRIWSETEGVDIDAYDGKVKGGKSLRVGGRIDTARLSAGACRITVNVQTNDPARPVTPLTLTAIIE